MAMRANDNKGLQDTYSNKVLFESRNLNAQGADPTKSNLDQDIPFNPAEHNLEQVKAELNELLNTANGVMQEVTNTISAVQNMPGPLGEEWESNIANVKQILHGIAQHGSVMQRSNQ